MPKKCLCAVCMVCVCAADRVVATIGPYLRGQICTTRGHLGLKGWPYDRGVRVAFMRYVSHYVDSYVHSIELINVCLLSAGHRITHTHTGLHRNQPL